MTDIPARMASFVSYTATLRGDEKGEAQVFCDRLFRAFGHEGYKEAGATLEERVKLADGRTKFADLRWGKRVLIEMKKRGERLGSPKVYNQVYEYWQRLVPNKPQYVVICNFDELWIYEFDQQLDEPMDRLKVAELPSHWTALNFLLTAPKEPQFKNNRKVVSDVTARKLGGVFRAMTDRGETRERAQRFTLQCVVAMFAEDTDLLPRGLFTELVHDCRVRGESSYDLLGGLFRQMNTQQHARAGRFKKVDYFNGGLFATIDPVEATPKELELLEDATREDWSRIHPGIFGTLFQSTMDERERHQQGAHYTPESAIFEHVVRPTLVNPLRARLQAASTLKDLLALRDALTKITVLDPACGSGNFLYVAYRELKRLELELLEKVHDNFSAGTKLKVGSAASIQTRQFFGLDTDAFAVELAKVTLMLGKKLALDEAHHALDVAQSELGIDRDQPLPLENLDANVVQADALFAKWPKADVIIGNPPFQSKNKMTQELGADYVKRVRAKYAGVPGRADYCVYWIRRTHDALPEGGRAGLVGTNTIRQNYSREGGLDYVVENGGTITEAVSTMVWPGDAVVHVSIANWVKGELEGDKKISWQVGDARDSPWESKLVTRIPSSLSAAADVTSAVTLQVNTDPQVCFQGQTPGHDGFVLADEEARAIRHDANARSFVHPYLIGEDLVGRVGSDPSRWIIDLNDCDDLLAARRAGAAYERLNELVKEDIQEAADKERDSTGKESGPRQSHAQRWWRHWRGRGDLTKKLADMKRYVACSRVTKRPIFEFFAADIRPSDVVMVFALEDDYSFGILQSNIHWSWFTARCSTLTARFRYTSETVFDSFPWPQTPTPEFVDDVASAARELRALRRTLAKKDGMSLRAMYASMEDPGKHPLKDAHQALDDAVRAAYGMKKKQDVLSFLLNLNASCAEAEIAGRQIVGPGIPPGHPKKRMISTDCVAARQL